MPSTEISSSNETLPPLASLAALPEELLAMIIKDSSLGSKEYFAMLHTCKTIRHKLVHSQESGLRDLQEYSKWKNPPTATQHLWRDAKKDVATAHGMLERWRLKAGELQDDWYCQACCRYRSQDEFFQASFGQLRPRFPAGRRFLRSNANKPQLRTCTACLLKFRGNPVFYQGFQTFIFQGKRCFLCSQCQKPMPEKVERIKSRAQCKSYSQRRVCVNCPPIRRR